MIGENTKIWHPELSNISENCEIGDSCVIHAFAWIGDKVIIGDRVKIQAFAFIPEGVVIYNDVFIGPRVTMTNDPDLKIQGRSFWKPTIIECGVKIGAGALIKAGVIIGENAIIGMGAIVLKDVPANEIWAGNPARKIK